MAKNTTASSTHHRCNSIPVLYTRGTHYEVGYDIGRTFGSIIQNFLKSFKFLNEELFPAFSTNEGKKAYEAGLKTVEKSFPQYVREIRGMAEGAKVPFEQLMLLHLDSQVCSAAGSKCGTPFGCTSICSNYEDQVFLGHTEDALADVLNHLYIVSAHITEDTPQGRYGTKQEGFTSLCYPGYLPGYCMAYNHHGLVYSINVLFAKEVEAHKTSPYFLTRALLAATSLQEAQTIMRDRGVGTADGFSVNMCFSKQEGDLLFHNAEVAPSAKTDESELSILTLSPGEHYLHANKYLRLKVLEDTSIEGPSSDRRHARAAELAVPNTGDSLLRLLSDAEDREYPIFRDNPGDDVLTVTLGLFDLTKNTWTFWMRSPQTTEPIITLPLIFKWNK